nr:Chain Q, Heat shock protein SSA1 [Saccharomyces cerevisiae]
PEAEGPTVEEVD